TSWMSAEPTIATISSSGTDMGMATGVTAGGPVTITASNNSVDGTAQLTVTAAALESITVTPNPITVGVGATSTGNLTATGNYSDGTTPDITTLVSWTGQDTVIATVDSGATDGGLVTGVVLGTTTTTATLDDGYGTIISSTPTTINVEKALVSIEVSPAYVRLVGSETEQLSAQATYDDASIEDVTERVAWVIEDPTAVSITEGVAGGIVSSTGADVITTAIAKLNEIESNNVQVATCSSLAGACIASVTIDSTIWAGTPSVLAARAIGWAPSAPTTIEECRDANLTNGLIPGCTQYIGRSDALIISDAQAYCDALTTVGFKGRRNWRLLEGPWEQIPVYEPLPEYGWIIPPVTESLLTTVTLYSNPDSATVSVYNTESSPGVILTNDQISIEELTDPDVWSPVGMYSGLSYSCRSDSE
ncbi:Ig-like domain-containing protein, partial [Vibrio parahaemolyticus]|nr:Ig-like domain-containing protein [Vibrio parahaemolyticus]